MRNITTKPPYSSSFVWLDSSSFPTPSTITLVQQHLSQHLPPELVDLILSYAEFWVHSTTRLDEPVRAFGPFTWGWREGNGIDYLNVWCPSGPGYAHLWNRWGESRRDDSFLLRSGPIGVEEEEEKGDGGRGLWRSRHLQESRLVRFLVSVYQKGAAVAGLSMRCRRRCQRRKKTGGSGTTNETFSWSRTAAVRKIVFETWSHQDYFGAVGDSAADDGAQQFARVFCDVSINRKKDVTPKARWKGRILRWRQRADANDIANDNDNNKNHEKSGRHGKLVAYKPFILENGDTPRCYFPRYHVNTWRWDDTTPSTPPSDHQVFLTAQGFLRQLEVGDTIGVWGRVGKGETYHIIDAMRMHVFWAA